MHNPIKIKDVAVPLVTKADKIRNIIERMRSQLFTSRIILNATLQEFPELVDDEDTESKHKLYEMVRWVVKKSQKKGIIKVVQKGRNGIAGVYKNTGRKRSKLPRKSE